MIQFSIFFLMGIASVFGGRCPKPAVIEPCRCFYKGQEDQFDRIQCGGDEIYDLKHIFTKLSESLNTTNKSEKHFDKFWFHSNAIEVIPEAVFGDITFDEIGFYQAKNLTKIHSLALGPSALTVKIFYLWHDLPSLENQLPDYDLFKMMRSMINVQTIVAFTYDEYNHKKWGPNVSVIPEYAFGEGQNNLNELSFSVDFLFTGSTIKTISNYSFYYLNNLRKLKLSRSSIDHIPAHAFDFEKSSNITLDIDLKSSNLNESSFEKGVFMNTKRPINLDLRFNKMKYLDEAVFGPLFSLDPNNKIQLKENELSCNDCRSQWLVRDKDELKDKIIGEIECIDNGYVKSFLDAYNFDKCKFM